MANERHGFVPQRPASDREFKRAYARVAVALGITAEQAIRIYAFETGGNGTYSVQAGLSHPSRKARAISTAVGYNQFLTANSIGLMALHGDRFIEILERKAETLSGPAKLAMEKKIAAQRRWSHSAARCRYDGPSTKSWPRPRGPASASMRRCSTSSSVR